MANTISPAAGGDGNLLKKLLSSGAQVTNMGVNGASVLISGAPAMSSAQVMGQNTMSSISGAFTTSTSNSSNHLTTRS